LKISAMEKGIGLDDLARRRGFADHRDFCRRSRKLALRSLRDPSLGLDR
jgi:hypothetical protein